MSASIFVLVLGLAVGTDYILAYLGVPQLYGPSEVLTDTIEEFRCELPDHPKNESVLLQLFKRGQNNTWLTESTSLTGEPGHFSLFIRPSYEGHLVCEASIQNRSVVKPTISNTHYLKVIEPVRHAKTVIVSGHDILFEGQTLELHCTVEAGNYVSYKWLLNNAVIRQETGTSHSGQLLIHRTTVADSGLYNCVATNRFNDQVFTNTSLPVNITVKAPVSAPDISYTVLKEDPNNYTAVITCESTRGTPPIIFSLNNSLQFIGSRESVNRRIAFKVPVIMDQNMGIFQCTANNGATAAQSQELSIHIVPVGGPVSLHYDYDVAENYAIVGLRFYCKVARGSHPRYQWFHNNTLMKDRGSFYYVVNMMREQSILLMSVGKSSAGTYHCLVSDSFDNTTALSSKKLYLDKQVLNRLPVLVIATVFGCFTFIILLVLICCGIVCWQRKREEKPLLLLGIKKTETAAYEKELDLSEYSDIELKSVMTNGCDFDQPSEESADEWQQIKETKRTGHKAIEAL